MIVGSAAAGAPRFPSANPEGRPPSLSIDGQLVRGANRSPVPLVPVTLSGVRGPEGRQITDDDGRFGFYGLSQGNYTLEFALADGRHGSVAIAVFDGPVRDVQINVDEVTARRVGTPADPMLRVWAQHIPRAAQKHYQQALAALEKNELDTSLQHLRRAVEIYPQFAAARAALGTTFLLRHEDEQATEAFEKALAIDGNLPDACFGLGSLYSQQKRYAEAETLLLRVQMLRPDDWRVYYALGENYFRAGQSEKAEQSLRRAHKLHAETPRLHVLFLNALLTQEKYSESLEEMDEFLRLFPDDKLALNLRQKRDALQKHLNANSVAAR